MQEVSEALSTGLEQWAQPVLYIAGVATAAATGISAGRFKASAHADLPPVKILTCVILVICAIAILTVAAIAAILMDPTKNPLPTAGLMLAISTIPQILIVCVGGSSAPNPSPFVEPTQTDDSEKPKP